MHKNRLLILVGIMIAVFAIAAVACDDDDDDDDDVSPTATVADDGDGNGAVTTLSALITGVDDAGITGTADLSVNGDGIRVEIVMLGLPEGAHANHIHHGSCADQGEIHITLDEIVADASGAGSQTTDSTEEGIDHFVTNHYVAVHADDGAVIACGDVV